MKKLTLLFAFMAVLSVKAQEIEIPAQRFPYHDIIEWKGMGAILMSKDPGATTNRIQLTLVADQETSVWDEYFTPRNEEFYYIASENARYVYFLDNLELESGKVYFTQLNSAGNKKTKYVSLINVLKAVGISNFNDAELVNVVVTDKALVHHFRYEDKKEKVVKEVATFIAHHNFIAYSVELGSIKMDDLKDNEDIGQWDYVGFNGENVAFAARDVQNKKKGWAVKEYTYKGKYLTTTFLEAPADLMSVENIGFGTTGKYYLGEKAKTTEKGIITYINGTFYMVGGERSDNSARLILYKWEENEWKELNDMNLNYFIEKKSLSLGLYPLNEGVGYHLDHNGYNKASIITYKTGEKSAHNSFTDRTIYNPTSVFIKKEKHEFKVTLPEAVLVFDTNQLGKEGPVKFVVEK